MTKPETHDTHFHSEKFTVLSPTPPFVDLILHFTDIDPQEFAAISIMAGGYSNDPRLIEMVRKSGDSSAKVPYLMDIDETPTTILATLREVAEPHVKHLLTLPEPVRATIHTLLSINAVPVGCNSYCIPALLEIDRFQAEIILALKKMMGERKLAKEFHQDNITALQHLDQEWHHLRTRKPFPYSELQNLPENSRMVYDPIFHNNKLTRLIETCVIVDSPGTRILEKYTPPVMQRPLPEKQPPPATGSADWLIREVGKIGRHFTRALLDIIKTRLTLEKIALEARNYKEINEQAKAALNEFMQRFP